MPGFSVQTMIIPGITMIVPQSRTGSKSSSSDACICFKPGIFILSGQFLRLRLLLIYPVFHSCFCFRQNRGPL